MQQSDIELDKYWLTQSGYFRLAYTLELGVYIKDSNLLFCHVISEESMDKNISTREYNTRTVYECFNKYFTADFGNPDLNLPTITIGDRPRQNKYPAIPQIFSHWPSILLLKILLVP